MRLGDTIASGGRSMEQKIWPPRNAFAAAASVMAAAHSLKARFAASSAPPSPQCLLYRSLLTNRRRCWSSTPREEMGAFLWVPWVLHLPGLIQSRPVSF